MLELEKGAMANHRLSAWARKKIVEAQKRRWQKIRGTSNRLPHDPPPVAKPLRSPLREKLVKNIRRELQDDEARFVRQVQRSFANARVRPLIESDLGAMAGRQIASASYSYWKEIDLWPDFPRDDFHFWLYVAWELRRRDWTCPRFMDGITDFRDRGRDEGLGTPKGNRAVAELVPRIRWSRARIRTWCSGLASGDLRRGGAAAMAHDANAAFTELKQAQAKKLAEQFDQGALAITPDSLPLWSAAYKPWHYESWWSFKYANATARPALNRLLRMPLAPGPRRDRRGQPLAARIEPLRLNLRPPQNGDGDYELALATADGSAPPRILCTLHGQPTLYLTEGGLFQSARRRRARTRVVQEHSRGGAGNSRRTALPARGRAFRFRNISSNASAPCPSRVTISCG